MHFIHMNRENFDEGSSFPGVQNGMKMNWWSIPRILNLLSSTLYIPLSVEYTECSEMAIATFLLL
jgi:hypothetical protein